MENPSASTPPGRLRDQVTEIKDSLTSLPAILIEQDPYTKGPLPALKDPIKGLYVRIINLINLGNIINSDPENVKVAEWAADSLVSITRAIQLLEITTDNLNKAKNGRSVFEFQKMWSECSVDIQSQSRTCASHLNVFLEVADIIDRSEDGESPEKSALDKTGRSDTRAVDEAS